MTKTKYDPERKLRSASSPAQPAARRAVASQLFEATVPEGLEHFAQLELEQLLAGQGRVVSTRPGIIRFESTGPMTALLGLRTVHAVYMVKTYPGARPTALLGHQTFEDLAACIQTVLETAGRHAFRTLFVSTAGRDSQVMRRFSEALSQRTGLIVGDENGDLLLRVRPLAADVAWEVMLRVSARPHSARAWRVANMPGALNGPTAHVMAQMGNPAPTDRILNIACGSGTIMIERLQLGPAAACVGLDIAVSAVRAAHANVAAAHLSDQVAILRGDAAVLPFAAGSFNIVFSDLPFGKLIGSHHANENLYPRLLDEIARVTVPDARVILITHELRLLDHAIADRSRLFRLLGTTRIKLGAMNPRMYMLVRTQHLVPRPT